MATDQELNEAVARKLGYGKHGTDCHGYVGIRNLETGKERRIWPPADYCTDISAAWEIVEKEGFCIWPTKDGKWFVMKDRFNTSYGDEYWFCGDEFLEEVKESDDRAIADTAPRAICLAFLKLP